MFKYPPARLSSRLFRQTEIVKLIWALLTICNLITMINPAQAVGIVQPTPSVSSPSMTIYRWLDINTVAHPANPYDGYSSRADACVAGFNALYATDAPPSGYWGTWWHYYGSYLDTTSGQCMAWGINRYISGISAPPVLKYGMPTLQAIMLCPKGYATTSIGYSNGTSGIWGPTMCKSISACPANSTGTAPSCTCNAGYQPDATATSCVTSCPAGQTPHPQTGCMLDCSSQPGTYPNLDDTACVPDTALGCKIKPMKPLPIASTDACTAALEDVTTSQSDRDTVCGTLTTAMQTEVECFTEKLKQKNITIDIGNKVRSTAYQAHFRDVWERMEAVMDRKVQKDSVMQAACAPRRAELATEKGCNHEGKCILANDCTAGGRNHCLKARPAKPDPFASHPKGQAIDISGANVKALQAALKIPPPPKTISQFLQMPSTVSPTVCPTAPKLQWGGTWDDPDTVHFYLP